MHNLGISVYPTQSDLGEMCDYIKMSAKFDLSASSQIYFQLKVTKKRFLINLSQW